MQLSWTQSLLLLGIGEGKLLRQNIESPTMGQVVVLYRRSKDVVQTLCTTPLQTLTPLIIISLVLDPASYISGMFLLFAWVQIAVLLWRSISREDLNGLSSLHCRLLFSTNLLAGMTSLVAPHLYEEDRMLSPGETVLKHAAPRGVTVNRISLLLCI